MGQHMLDLGFLAHVGGVADFSDNYVFFRFLKNATADGDGGDGSGGACLTCAEQRLDDSLLRFLYALQRNSVLDWMQGATPDDVRVVLPVIHEWAIAIGETSAIDAHIAQLVAESSALQFQVRL
jgi:hypothetical protein